MAKQVRDLRCGACGTVYEDQVTEYASYPPCQCGGSLAVTWERGRPPATDLYGSPQYSDASGQVHSSTREKEKALREVGFYPAGDKVGGARADHRIDGSAFSYPGQPKRTSTAERG